VYCLSLRQEALGGRLLRALAGDVRVQLHSEKRPGTPKNDARYTLVHSTASKTSKSPEIA
jgi:hypothetical protein